MGNMMDKGLATVEASSPSEVKKLIRSKLPAHMFKPTPCLVLFPIINALLMILGIYAVGQVDSWILKIGITLLVGHQMFVVGNFSHYLSHLSIISNRRLCYVFEVLLWGVAGSSATVWVRSHNAYHHQYTNGNRDTFRAFSETEATPKRRWIHRLLSPNGEVRFSPMVLMTYFATHSAYFSGALYGKSGDISSVVPFVPDFSKAQKRKVLFEIAVMVSVQVGFFFLVGADWLTYLMVYALSTFIGSGIASIYLFTQHSLFPLSDDNDPIRNSASLRVNPVIDWWHMYVSRHVEHHYIPNMSPIYLPHVTKLLEEHYPSLYTRTTFGEVLPDIFSLPLFKEDTLSLRKDA